MKLKPQSDEYRQLRGFYALAINEVIPPAVRANLHPDEHPMAALALLENSRPALAAKALQIGVNDVVFDLMDQPSAVRTALNEALIAAGLPTIGEVMHRFTERLQAIITRGKIRNETEYYLVKEVLDGFGEGLGADMERRLIEQLELFAQRVSRKQAKPRPGSA